MNRSTAIAVLAVAALLEAGGDAVIRHGLRTGSAITSLLWFVLGATVLFAYGWLINATPWDFGRLIGLYVVFFFMAAQLISWLVFRQMPDGALLLGGALIVAGGIVISLGSAGLAKS
jgi:drug/metabolite transporter superfamily protein YnfA